MVARIVLNFLKFCPPLGMVVALFFTTAALAGPVDLTTDLKERCLVWKPEHCTDVQKQADARLIAAIEKKTTRPLAAKDIVQRAWVYYLKDKDPLTALYRFNQALILDPTLGEAWWGAGTILSENGMGGDGEKLLLKGAALDPRRPEPHLALGRYYFLQKKNPPLAGREVEVALKLNPKLADGHLWMARILIVQKKKSESARAYQKARELGASPDPELEVRLKDKK